MILGITYFVHKRKYKGEKKYPWGRAFLWLVFLGYMIVVIYATMLRWTGFFHREWNIHLFRAWREAWNNVSVINCALGYEIDTKGFYLPVYYFEVASQDGTYEYRTMIPAMK